jgi:probable 2-oxoglutarate dehydrogenase E1 component DHKTD1
MLRNFRKPLVVAAPKVGLKHPKAVSALHELGIGTKFEPILEKTFGDESAVETVIFCSGKVGFDIEDRLKKANVSGGVKMIKIEEIAPFPVQNIRDTLANVADGARFVWVQEEGMNQGAF